MLVLTHKTEESIHIKNDIKVIILDTLDTHKIGVVAPSDVLAHRSEIYHKIKQFLTD